MTEETTLKCCSKREACVHPNGPWLPATLEYFGADKRIRSGLKSECRACKRHHDALSHAKNREANNKTRRQWTVDHPERSRETSRRWHVANKEKANAQSRLWYQQNKEKAKERTRLWRIANLDKKRENNKLWYKTNKEKWRVWCISRRARIKKAAGRFTATDVKHQYDYQNGKCYWCGVKLKGKYHIDHIIALDKGGSNYPDNICCACADCNLSKGNKSLKEWGRLL